MAAIKRSLDYNTALEGEERFEIEKGEQFTLFLVVSKLNGIWRVPGAFTGICKRGAQNLKAFFFFFFFFAFQLFREGPAQKIAEKMIFSTKKVAKYR